jgi:hypothetical protein
VSHQKQRKGVSDICDVVRRTRLDGAYSSHRSTVETPVDVSVDALLAAHYPVLATLRFDIVVHAPLAALERAIARVMPRSRGVTPMPL